MLTNPWIVFAAASISTYLLAHLYRVVAVRFHWVDHPNHRSAHKEPVPTGAGVSFVLVFLVILFVLNVREQISHDVFYACLGPVFIALVGFRDDIRSLHFLVRAPAHFVAAAWCIYWIGFPELNVQGVTFDLGVAGLLFGAVALVWLLNLYNFMDGIDGLAAGEAVFACFGALLLTGWPAANGWNMVAWVAFGLSLGFLVINWPPAKVFMGDVGSGFLGLLLGVLTLAHLQVSVWSWVILLGYFITDACLTITIRLIRGDKIHESHNLHAYQHLTRRFGGHRTLLAILSANLFWLLPVAWLAHLFPDMGLVLLILASLPLLVAEFICGAGQEQPLLTKIRTS